MPYAQQKQASFSNLHCIKCETTTTFFIMGARTGNQKYVIYICTNEKSKCQLYMRNMKQLYAHNVDLVGPARPFLFVCTCSIDHTYI